MKSFRGLLIISLAVGLGVSLAAVAWASAPRLTDEEIRLLEEYLERAKTRPAQKSGTTVLTEAINLNQAGAVELQRLEGIGPEEAQAIISYREKHGPFKRPEDLIKVKGIEPEVLQLNLQWVVVE